MIYTDYQDDVFIAGRDENADYCSSKVLGNLLSCSSETDDKGEKQKKEYEGTYSTCDISMAYKECDVVAQGYVAFYNCRFPP